MEKDDNHHQYHTQGVNSDEIQEIITAVPSWIIRRGITLIFCLIAAIIIASAFIRYPDVIKTSLRVNSLNAPKSAFSRQTGKITSLLIPEGEPVEKNEPLAFMESTASHPDVLRLGMILQEFVVTLNLGTNMPSLPSNLHLGELQGPYQSFYQQYLLYLSTQKDGYYIHKKKYLKRDLMEIKKLEKEIIAQSKIQEQEYANVEDEYESYKKLYQKGIISKSEFRQQENKYLSGKQPLNQTVTSLINNKGSYTAKEKEIFDLEHTIHDEKAKFLQALNNMAIETQAWINQYIIKAPVTGTVTYAGIIQENQTVISGTELFIVSPNNTDFFGEIYIPQYSMGKVKTGQKTMVKMKSYPFEQYGVIQGKISYISDAAFKDSVFIAKIKFEKFENKNSESKIILKNGMHADAEIITDDSSLLKRFTRNITKMFGSRTI